MAVKFHAIFAHNADERTSFCYFASDYQTADVEMSSEMENDVEMRFF